MKKTSEETKRNFAKIFNVNNILGKIISWAAYFILAGSVLILTYLSFIETFDADWDWRTIGIFSGAVILLGFTCWTTFYHKQYEKLMDADINQQASNEYSIHARYYAAIKDWKDADLQEAIDKFNDEYHKKWLTWVEKTTGVPIESHKEVQIDPVTKEETVVEIKGIKDLPYKGFKYKRLMWKVKNHKYPSSGYKTSMELSSLFSYQDANFNKRNLRADKSLYVRSAISKVLISIFITVAGASLIPHMIKGEYWAAVLKLIIAIGSLFSSTFFGAIKGIRGARLKLSIVEDACCDLEHWAEKKPIIEPYKLPEQVDEDEPKENESRDTDTTTEVTEDIFSQLNIAKK